VPLARESGQLYIKCFTIMKKMVKKNSDLRLEDLAEIFEDAVYTVDVDFEQEESTRIGVKELKLVVSLIEGGILRFTRYAYTSLDRDYLLFALNEINQGMPIISACCGDETDSDGDYAVVFTYDHYIDEDNNASNRFIVRMARNFVEMVDNALNLHIEGWL
jgi:hypothetical protein